MVQSQPHATLQDTLPKTSVLRRMMFQPRSATLPSDWIHPLTDGTATGVEYILVYLRNAMTMFTLLLEDVIFTRQDFTDCTGRLWSVSGLNNNHGNAETKAVAALSSSYGSLHPSRIHTVNFHLQAPTPPTSFLKQHAEDAAKLTIVLRSNHIF